MRIKHPVVFHSLLIMFCTIDLLSLNLYIPVNTSLNTMCSFSEDAFISYYRMWHQQNWVAAVSMERFYTLNGNLSVI